MRLLDYRRSSFSPPGQSLGSGGGGARGGLTGALVVDVSASAPGQARVASGTLDSDLAPTSRRHRRCAPLRRCGPRRSGCSSKKGTGFGDLAASLPALKAVRRGFPDLSVLIKGRAGELLRRRASWLDAEADSAARRAARSAVSPIDRLVVAEIRARRVDLAVLFPRSRVGLTALARAAAARRLRADGRGLMLTHKTVRPAALFRSHQVYDYLYLLRQHARHRRRSRRLRARRQRHHRDTMRDWLTTSPARRWSADRARSRRRYGPPRNGRWRASPRSSIGWPRESWGRVRAGRRRASGRAARWWRRRAGTAPDRRQRETSVGQLVGAAVACATDSPAMTRGACTSPGALGASCRPSASAVDQSAARTGPLARTPALYRRIECSPCLKRTCKFGHYVSMKRVPGSVESALLELRAGREESAVNLVIC